MTFRITVQDTRVVERSYDIEAPDVDEAHELFYELEPDEAAKLLIHEETVSSNYEITGAEPCV